VRGALWASILACACAWIVGRVVSDRYAWTQPISWIPTPALLVPVWAAFGVTAWRARRRVIRARRRRTAAPPRSVGARCRFALLSLFALGSVWHFGFIELGLHRVAIGPGRVARISDPDSVTHEPLRLVFWNQAGHEAGDISQVFLDLDPTFFVIANRHSATSTRDLARAFIDSGEAHGAVGWPFDLFGRAPIRRWASTSLGLAGRSRTKDGSARADPGWAAWYEVMTPGGTLVIWAIDLPSDPSLSRFLLARQAGEKLATWEGSVRIIDQDGEHSRSTAVPGFPAPDVIVGDFNIPRRSASLGEFLRASGAGKMRNAFDLAGVGWQRTWPRERPVWAIDHCLVGPRLDVRSFATFDPGVGGHRAIVIELDAPIKNR
jgi:hypothetical protein